MGTLEDYEAALERCAAQLRRVQERKDKVTAGHMTITCMVT